MKDRTCQLMLGNTKFKLCKVKEMNHANNCYRTSRCAFHQLSSASIVPLRSFHPNPVAQFLNSSHCENSFFTTSHLFFNCFLVRRRPVLLKNLSDTLLKPVVVRKPRGLLPASHSSLHMSQKYRVIKLSQLTLSIATSKGDCDIIYPTDDESNRIKEAPFMKT